MKKLIMLLSLCVCILFTGGCNFKIAKDALLKTVETLNDKESEVPPSNGDDFTAVSLTETIRSDNKTISGDDKTQWIEMYKEQLYPNTHKNITEIIAYKTISLPYLSNELDVQVTNFVVYFDDKHDEKLEIIDIDSTYLVDIINTNNMTVLFDHYFIYNLLKTDTRFADKLVDSIDNKYPENVIEIDLAKLVPQYYDNYMLLSMELMNDDTSKIELVNHAGEEHIILEYDYINRTIITENKTPPTIENSPEIKIIDSPDGKHTAYIDEDSRNIYVRDIDSGDVWLIYEVIQPENEITVIYTIYKNKLIYSHHGESSIFGIYDLKTNVNVIYDDSVNIRGIQDGVLFLGTSKFDEPPHITFTLDLNSTDYTLTDLSDIVYDNIYIPENGDVYITVNQNNIQVYNIVDNTLIFEYNFSLISTNITDIKYDNGKLILICRRDAMGHDYVYIIDIK